MRKAASPRTAGTRLNVADLFAGAGGLTEGFHRGGFAPTVAVEYDLWAARTYAANFGEHALACPIEDVSVEVVSGNLLWSGRSDGAFPITIETPKIDVPA